MSKMDRGEIVEFIGQAVMAFIRVLKSALNGDEDSHRRVNEVLDPVSKNRLQMIRAQAVRERYYGQDPSDPGTTSDDEG